MHCATILDFEVRLLDTSNFPTSGGIPVSDRELANSDFWVQLEHTMTLERAFLQHHH